jgi:hypothetical protein
MDKMAITNVKIAMTNANMAMKVPNGHEKEQKFPSQSPPKYTIVGIFGIKMYAPSGNPAWTPTEVKSESFVLCSGSSYYTLNYPEVPRLWPEDFPRFLAHFLQRKS